MTNYLNSPQLYTDPQVFAQERQGLFSEQWIFAGMAHQLRKHNDFIRVDLLGRDVIIQNLRDKLVAFVNVCSHRHSIIHDAPSGNRSLTCPYHSWHYNEAGIPTGIPCKKAFPAVTANPEAYKLQSLELARAGDFIFLRVNEGEASLASFLGDAMGFLEQVSASLGECIDVHESAIQANWKLVIENSLEGYHVPFVHKTSLAKSSEIQFSQDEEDSEEFLPESGHSSVHNHANEKWLLRWTRYQKDIGQWPFMFEHYVHQLVFPNLTVTSFLGYSFHVQHFRPLAHDLTSVHSSIYSTRFSEQTARGQILMKSIQTENIGFTHQVFDEDKTACERTQRGSVQAFRPSIPGQEIEQRVIDFRKTYHRLQKLD